MWRVEGDLKQAFQENFTEKGEPEGQVQISKSDQISGVHLEITYLGIMRLQGRNSLFRRTIFRFFGILLPFSDKQEQALDVLQKAASDGYRNMGDVKSLSEPWIGVTRFALFNSNLPKWKEWQHLTLSANSRHLLCWDDDHAYGEIVINARSKCQRKRESAMLCIVATQADPNGTSCGRPYAREWLKMESKTLHVERKITST